MAKKKAKRNWWRWKRTITYRVGFVNSGRSKRGSGPVWSTIKRLRESLVGQKYWIATTAEFGEGDKTKPTDHEILKKVFPKERKAHMQWRSPMVFSSSLRNIYNESYRIPGSAVPKLSPMRLVSVSDVVPAKRFLRGREPGVTILGGHYPAGAYNGHRSPAAKRLLRIGYNAMLREHKKQIKKAHKRGNNVIWSMDCNHRRFPKLHPDEVQFYHSGPDYIRAVPLPGYKAVLVKKFKFKNDVEGFHKGLVVDVKFVEDKK